MFLPSRLGLATNFSSLRKTKKTAPIPMPEAAKSNSESLKKLYHDMLLIRRFEERAGQLYGMGLIGGFCHLYIGQEAVVVGLMGAAKQGDQQVTSYRDHGHMLAQGLDPKAVMAELTGRSTGLSRGKRGRAPQISPSKKNTHGE